MIFGSLTTTGVGSIVGVNVGSGVKVGTGVGEYAATVCVIIRAANSIALVPITSTAGSVGVAGAQAARIVIPTKMIKINKRYFIVPLYICSNFALETGRIFS